MHLLRVGDELLAEVGMRDADERLGTLPGRKALEVDHAILGDDVVRAGARVGADGAGRQRGNDAALDRAVLARDGRGHADEALAALGEVRAHRKVELAARAGDVLDARGLRVHLTEQIAVDGVVDGDEVVDLGDDKHVVRIVDRRTHDLWIAIHVVIELLRAGGEGKDLTALVELLVLAGDLAGEGHVDKAVDIHFGVNGQVLEVRLRDHRADGVRHTADAELQAGTVCNAVAGEAHVAGSLRVFTDDMFDRAREGVRRVLDDACAATGCTYDLDFAEGYPPVDNDPELFASVAPALPGLQLMEEPLLIAEDFAFYQRHLPGVFFLLGTGMPEGQDNPSDSDGCPAYATSALHTDSMLFDEEILLKGLDVYKRLLVME